MDGWLQRQELLVGSDATKRLAKARVALFGVGGVGSFSAEALARAGVGTVALVDKDTVSESNINRQLVALKSTLGLSKTSVMARRIADINPDCRVIEYREFYTAGNCDFINLSDFDFIIDAIDTVSSKLLLIERAKASNTKIISCMGAGNKLDPTAFRITDIFKTEGCPLARVMRTELRKRGVTELAVVFSDEHTRASGGRTVGSISFVPPCAGFAAAGYVIRNLISEELI